MKIGLGTVQFGLDYGISNTRGQCTADEINKIMSLAHSAGITLIDTASAYGDSEQRLGDALHHSDYRPAIVTKTPAFREPVIGKEALQKFEAAFESSLSKLKVELLYGLLFHDADDLFKPGGDKLMEAAARLKRDGHVSKIGISVYTPEQVRRVLATYPVDLVQLPVNVFDQRFLSTGCLAELRQRNIEIHARSIFLQGVLLMAENTLPDYFRSIRPTVKRYQQAVSLRGWSLLRAALQFATHHAKVDYAIIGVTAAQELAQICAEAEKCGQAPSGSAEDDFSWPEFAIEDEAIILPFRWKV